MSFTIITDTSSNLPTEMLMKHNVKVIALSYFFENREQSCTDTREFEAERYYEEIKKGAVVTTSQIAPQNYVDFMTPILSEKEDILFVGMSSGISGSYNSAEIAAAQLREEFPERRIRLVDTLAASLGEGIFVMHAIEYRDNGLDLDATADRLLAARQSVYQGVMLDDLMYLKRGGRISGAKAVIGTVLGIKPILKGNRDGELVVCGKVRGHKNALANLANTYNTLVKDPEKQTVGIVYTDCKENAVALAEMIKATKPPKEVMIVCYEPVTGSHVGPGTVALFFEGADGVRDV